MRLFLQRSWVRPQVIRTGILLTCFYLICCLPLRIRLSNAPSEIKSLEGHASCRLQTEETVDKVRFSFLFDLPDRARIDVSDLLGRTIYQIYIMKEGAFLIIPSKKIFWQGEEKEIVDVLLGFPLSLQEMLAIFLGKWEKELSGWALEKDQQHRISAGKRENLSFRILKYLPESSVAQEIQFVHPLSKSHVKIIQVDFNLPLKAGVFSISFLGKYEKKTWNGIQKILNDED